MGKTFKADMASNWHDTVRLQMYKEIQNFKQHRVGVGMGGGDGEERGWGETGTPTHPVHF